MVMKKLAVKKGATCMACLACVEACSNAYYKESNVLASCIQIVERKGEPRPVACPQCGNCDLVGVDGAFTLKATGFYLLKKKLCTGCGKCVEVCPFGLMVKVDAKPVASKCIACGICVKACPMDVLEIVEK